MAEDKLTHELDAKTQPIRAVTVYKNKARLERLVKVVVVAGANEIIITKLTPGLDSESLRVETTSYGVEASVHDVNVAYPVTSNLKTPAHVKSKRNVDHPEVEALSDEQKANYARLLRRKDLLNTRMATLDRSAALVNTYADNLVRPRQIARMKGFNADDSHQSLCLDDLNNFLDQYPGQIDALMEKWQEARGELDEVEDAIDTLLHTALEAMKAQPKLKDNEEVSAFGQFKSRPNVTISLVAEQEGSVELRLSYLVNGPSWIGSYDLHATLPYSNSKNPSSSDPEKGTNEKEPPVKITLLYRASITQRSGEDWNNAELTLSTASPGASAVVIPQLTPWKITAPQTFKPALPTGFAFPVNAANPYTGGVFGQAAANAANNSNISSLATSGFGAFGGGPQPPLAFGKPNIFGQPLQQQQQQQNSPQKFVGAPLALSGGNAPPTVNAFGASSAFGSLTQKPEVAPTSTSSVDPPRAAPMTQMPLFGAVKLENKVAPFGQASLQPLSDTPDHHQRLHPDNPHSSLGRGTVSTSTGTVAASIKVDGLTSIPSDGSSHKVLVTTLVLDAEVDWISVPRLNAAAFIRCRVTNTSDFMLTGGTSQIFFDGSFVSKSTLPDVNPGEKFSCSLGTDPGLKITYHPQQRITRETKPVSGSTGWTSVLSGSSGNKTKTDATAYATRITVKNTRSWSIPRLVLQDQVPVSEDERIKVTVINPSGEAVGPIVPPISMFPDVKKDVDPTLVANVRPGITARWSQKSDEGKGSGGTKGDGVLEWICEDVKDELDVELMWNVSAPEGLLPTLGPEI